MTARFLLCFALTVFAALFAGRAAQAQSCTFSATDVVFGSVDTVGSADTDSTGIITVQCNAFLGVLSSIQMSINIGEGRGGATASERRMASLTTTTPLGFQLYKDAARTQAVGSNYWSFGGTPFALSDAALLALVSGSSVSLQVYGRVAGGQNSVVPGSYRSAFDRNPTDVRVDYRTCNLLLICTNRSATFAFNVPASVNADCRVSASDLAFGTVGLLDTDQDAASRIDVSCTPLSAYSNALGAGLHAGTGTARRMQDAAGHRIDYGLFQDTARSVTWGAVANGAARAAAGTGRAQQYPIYGRVPAQPTPPAGLYSDSVVVTITY